MKDLSIYFRPFDDFSVSEDETIASVSRDIDDIEANKATVAIVSVPEFRNGVNSKTPISNQSIIDSLLRLYKGDWDLNLLLLGEIVPGNTIQDTFTAIGEVVSELLKNNIIPFIIGGSQDLTVGIYKAFEKLEQTVNIVDFNPKPDVGDLDEEMNAEAWLASIIGHKPSYLFNYSLIGYQNYLSKPSEIDLLNKMYFDTERLGNFYGNEKRIEPLVRNADILSFDLDSIRGSDFNANSKGLPHGFYGQDACRVFRYAGYSDKIGVAGAFYNTAVSLNTNDSNLVAQLIWHFIDGISQRKKDYPIGTKDNYKRFIVSIDDFKDEIIFYKSNTSGRWWMEVPYPKTDKLRFQRHFLVPCNYEDYENALLNDIPDLWWKTHQKLL